MGLIDAGHDLVASCAQLAGHLVRSEAQIDGGVAGVGDGQLVEIALHVESFKGDEAFRDSDVIEVLAI